MKTLLITAAFILSSKAFAACEEAPGIALNLEYPSATFSMYETLDRFNRLDVFSGGAVIQTYEPSPEDNSKIVSTHSHIWKEKKGWCFNKSAKASDVPQSCDFIFDQQELRNKDGEIIGLVELKGEDVIFKQSKKPFSKNSANIDPKADIVKLSVSGKETTLSALSSSGEIKDGVAKILGEPAKTGRGKNLVPYPIGRKKDYTSNCSETKIVDNSAAQGPAVTPPPVNPPAVNPSKKNRGKFVGLPLFQCGNIAISETYLGEYAIEFGVGSYGGGRSMPVNVSAEMVNDECLITASSTRIPEHWKFAFGKDDKSMKGKRLADAKEGQSAWGLDCNMGPRYTDTLGKCKMPTDTDPRNKCFDIPGKSIAITQENNSFNSNKIDLFSGGVVIEDFQEEKKANFNQAQDLAFWKKDSQWCMGSPRLEECEKPFTGSREIKNSNGEIIGLVETAGDNLLFRQVKAPFSKTSATIDEKKPVMKLSAADKVTTMSVLSQEGGSPLSGIAKVEGSFENYARRNYGATPLKIGDSKDLISDCNGLKKDESVGSAHKKAEALER